MKMNLIYKIILIVFCVFCSYGCKNNSEELSKPVKNLNQSVAESVTATGRIIFPSNGEKVSSVFDYEVELQNPDETKYYYIANRIGGLYWPKVRINLKSGVTNYKGESSEGGNPPAGRFSVVLFEIDKAMHENIVRWMNSGSFPGIQIEGRELASVDVILKNNLFNQK